MFNHHHERSDKSSIQPPYDYYPNQQPQMSTYGQSPPPGYGQAPPLQYGQQQQVPYGQSSSYQPSQHATPYGNFAPPPQPHRNPPVAFRFSGNKKSVLNSTATDPWGRTVLAVSSTKKESVITNGEKGVIATVDWKHSSPRMHYHGVEVKIKDFMPYNKKTKARTIHHGGQTYDWIEQSNGEVWLTPMSSPTQAIAIWRDPNDIIELEVSPEGLQSGMVEVCLIAVFLMNTGIPFGDVTSSGGLNAGILGGIIGATSGLY